ncbi:hypothetical protein IKF63_01260 [Candidatus Saccharibacteria bacterium]|nr:hypothetical protein [Candidatus Saccharibacteria bacterium]
MKVLILSCNTGGGHNSCAKYIKEELNANKIPAEIVDFLSIANEHISTDTEKLYLKTTKGRGKAFGAVYKIGELYNKTKIKSPVYLASSMSKTKLLELIKKEEFDLVICTHLFPSLAMTRIKKDYNIPLVNIATDYECIPFWDETKPDVFIIPSELLTKDFTRKGIEKSILKPLGIPISSSFTLTEDNIDLPTDRDVILLTSGSMGFGKIYELVKLILNEFPEVCLVSVCGNNMKLYQKLRAINNNRLIVKGFVTNMNSLIEKSTIVVTKPGGLTTTEIATIRKPIVHMMPIPGVERHNAKFYSENGMSLCSKNEEEVLANIKLLLGSRRLRKNLIDNQKKIINRTSAADLVKFLKENYN